MERQKQYSTACRYHQEILYYRFRLRVFMCSFMAFIAVLFIVGCFVIQVFNSSVIFSKRYDLSEGDMRVISVSTTFCEGISLHSSRLLRTLTVVNQVQTTNELHISNISLDVYIPPHKYWYKAFYLLQGSHIQVEAKAESSFQLLIFKGKSNLESWTVKQKRHHDKPNINNKDKSTRISYVYNVSQDEDHYILFKRISAVPRVVGLSISLSISRRRFDVSNPVVDCKALAGKPCEVRLLFNSQEKTIVEVSERSDENLYVNNFPSIWSCQPRVWFYMIVFGGGYIVCVSCTSVLYIILLNSKVEKIKNTLRKSSFKCKSISKSSYRERAGSTGKKRGVGQEMFSMTLPSRGSSFRANGQSKRPVVGVNSSLKRDSSLPAAILQFYKGNSSDSDHEEAQDLESFHQLRRVPSCENISVASFDTTVSLPVTFNSFNKRNADADSISCHSFRHDVNHHRFPRHRDRHHPRFYQELRLERDNLRDNSLSVKPILHQSDAQLSRVRNLTLPARLSCGRENGFMGRNFYRDLERAALQDQEQSSHNSSSSTPTFDHNSGHITTKSDRPPRGSEADSFLKQSRDSQLDRRAKTLPSRGKRDFYRDLEEARKRDSNYNYDRLNSDSDYEQEFERAIERHEKKRLILNPQDFDLNESVGDKLDRIADAEDHKKKHREPTNGYPPQLEPLLRAVQIYENENNLESQAKSMPNVKINKKKRSKNQPTGNKDVKLRNPSSNRHKDRFWRPRLSIVSEI